MRICTWNVNGVRAAHRKGLWRHLKRLNPDAVMLQEIRCTPEQAPPEITRQRTYTTTWHPAQKLGYAGTLTWTKGPHEVRSRGIGGEDVQGRALRTMWNGIELINIYLPSGSRSPEAQASKEAWMARFRPWAAALAAQDHPVILGGDLNIAHTKNDIHNPTGNKRNSGFLPHERVWFGELLSDGWTDVIRQKFGEVRGPWSWWSNRGRARELDRGWRIDYLLTNAAATARVVDAGIVRKGGLEVSDHAPVWVDLT
jgi:exodeoxyribonuclease-3